MAGKISGALNSLLTVVLARSPKKGGLALTGTWTPSAASAVLPVPQFQDFLQDLFTSRQATDSRALIQLLAKNDPDVSATFNAYMTTANTDMVAFAKQLDGTIDPDATQQLNQIILLLTRQWDYTQGFQLRRSIASISTEMRYMVMMRGCIAAELVFDKNLAPSDIRLAEPMNLFWWEKTPGAYKPELRQVGSIIELDIPSFFVSFHHRDPTTIYSDSSFVAAINTIAARQEVVNDLYRILRVTGFPRLDVKIVEEILRKNAPPNIRQNAEQMKSWVIARMAEMAQSVSSLRPDQAFVHPDSVEISTVNDKTPGASIDISPMIDVLNGQNQAALKIMATIIGRGESGVNTASVESRIFSMNADELNRPVAEVWSNIFTLALRMQGFTGYVEVSFKPAELRPASELEPHLSIRSARLKQDLSLGLISDEEYHLWLYNRLPPPGTPQLSGTQFMQPETTSGAPDANAGTAPSAGGDSLARSATSPGAKQATSKANKTGPSAAKK
jgi:hypothetical protein